MGRAGKPNPVVCDAVIAWISEGKTLRDFCRQPQMPSHRTIYDWLEDDEEFALRFARAREAGHDVIADECFQIADEMPPTDENGRTDSGFVAWQKNRIWTRTQLLAKWNPKKYGEKVGVEHSGNVGLSINIDLK